ncbi:glycine-rich protein-like [Ziziphus jujuba]|uniref:Glycine-rich protein-like n=1 Tax=Ziziphus jujuba TaxID=326968 RepID=A0ABM4A822_ZIZJJ|nr:glycine-rich protein-like [Ziziphus jujuba]
MVPKAFPLLNIALVFLLLISSLTAAARGLSSTTTFLPMTKADVMATSNGEYKENHHGDEGDGSTCHYGCCIIIGNCGIGCIKCCSYAGDAVHAQTRC